MSAYIAPKIGAAGNFLGQKLNAAWRTVKSPFEKVPIAQGWMRGSHLTPFSIAPQVVEVRRINIFAASKVRAGRDFAERVGRTLKAPFQIKAPFQKVTIIPELLYGPSGTHILSPLPKSKTLEVRRISLLLPFIRAWGFREGILRMNLLPYIGKDDPWLSLLLTGEHKRNPAWGPPRLAELGNINLTPPSTHNVGKDDPGFGFNKG